MVNKFKRKCHNCENYYFTFFDLLKLLDGGNIKCSKCIKKFHGKEPWISLFHVLIGLLPIVLVLNIVFYGLLLGLVVSILGFIIISGLLVFLMPIKQNVVQSKSDVIDNLKKTNPGQSSTESKQRGRNPLKDK